MSITICTLLRSIAVLLWNLLGATFIYDTDVSYNCDETMVSIDRKISAILLQAKYAIQKSQVEMIYGKVTNWF